MLIVRRRNVVCYVPCDIIFHSLDAPIMGSPQSLQTSFLNLRPVIIRRLPVVPS